MCITALNMHYSLKKCVLSLETWICSLKAYIFSLKTYVFSLTKHGQSQNVWIFWKYCVIIIWKILQKIISTQIIIEYPITITERRALLVKPSSHYRVCHGFRFTTQVAYSWVDFDPFEASVIFWCTWASIENWLEHKAKPPSGNLACPSLWNVL